MLRNTQPGLGKMYTYSDSELVENISEPTRWLFFWFRDMCEEAERRGLVTINHSEVPFWWDTSQVVLTSRGQELLDKMRNRV